MSTHLERLQAFLGKYDPSKGMLFEPLFNQASLFTFSPDSLKHIDLDKRIEMMQWWGYRFEPAGGTQGHIFSFPELGRHYKDSFEKSPFNLYTPEGTEFDCDVDTIHYLFESRINVDKPFIDMDRLHHKLPKHIHSEKELPEGNYISIPISEPSIPVIWVHVGRESFVYRYDDSFYRLQAQSKFMMHGTQQKVDFIAVAVVDPYAGKVLYVTDLLWYKEDLTNKPYIERLRELSKLFKGSKLLPQTKVNDLRPGTVQIKVDTPYCLRKGVYIWEKRTRGKALYTTMGDVVVYENNRMEKLLTGLPKRNTGMLIELETSPSGLDKDDFIVYESREVRADVSGHKSITPAIQMLQIQKYTFDRRFYGQ